MPFLVLEGKGRARVPLVDLGKRAPRTRVPPHPNDKRQRHSHSLKNGSDITINMSIFKLRKYRNMFIPAFPGMRDKIRCIDGTHNNMYNIVMRTNIVLDKNLVNEALKLSDAKSMREVVDKALQEFVARRKQRDLLKLRGAGWDGDLKEMRKGRVGSY